MIKLEYASLTAICKDVWQHFNKTSEKLLTLEERLNYQFILFKCIFKLLSYVEEIKEYAAKNTERGEEVIQAVN